MSQQVQKSIDSKKQYIFPQSISIIHYDSKILVIAVETGNWIVLENNSQLEFFNLLKEYTLEKSLELFKGEQKDADQTVMQLEARHFENQITKKTDKKSVMIYLTQGCNMRCPHCYMYAGFNKENELSADEIIGFLEIFKKNSGCHVKFSGGEVCTRSDFVEIINRTYELGLEIEVLTNGTLWTDEMINELAPKLAEVQISIDGYCEEENARIRGKGNFKKALSTVDKFVNLGSQVRIATTPYFDITLESKIDKYVDFAKKLIEKYKGKKFDIIYTGEMIKGRDINLSEKENDKYGEIVEELYEKSTGVTKESSFITSHRRFDILDNCSFGNLYIDSNGDVYACSRISDIKPFANIRTSRFEEISEISKKAMFVSCIDNLTPCNKCELKYICGGGCRLVYFKEISQLNNFDNVKLEPRKCSQKYKNSFYDLMIKTNKDIFQ